MDKWLVNLLAAATVVVIYAACIGVVMLWFGAMHAVIPDIPALGYWELFGVFILAPFWVVFRGITKSDK